MNLDKKEMRFYKRLIRSFKIYTDMMNEIKLKIDKCDRPLGQILEASDKGLYNLVVVRQHVVMTLNNMYLCKVSQDPKNMTFTDSRVEQLSGEKLSGCGSHVIKLLIPIIFILFLACSNAGMFSLFGVDPLQPHGKLPLVLQPQSLASVTSLSLGLHFKEKMQEEQNVEIGVLSLLQFKQESVLSRVFGNNPLSNDKKNEATAKINTALSVLNHDLNNFCRNDLRTMDFSKFIKDMFEKNI